MELNQFLIHAKLHTYASMGEETQNLLEDGSRELVFIQGQFRYRDRYSGLNPFIGEELVWEDGRLIWGMNYYGKALEEFVPASQIYSFLRQAILMVRPERPYRGPEFFRAGHFTYVDKSQGELDNFTGEEIIFFRDQQVYHLVYHGGGLTNLGV
jgi:hypothetical protein